MNITSEIITRESDKRESKIGKQEAQEVLTRNKEKGQEEKARHMRKQEN